MSGFKYKRPRPKSPSDVFDHCLSCGSKDLLRIDPDLQCMRCDWNTFQAHVDAGGFDINVMANSERRPAFAVVEPLIEQTEHIETKKALIVA